MTRACLRPCDLGRICVCADKIVIYGNDERFSIFCGAPSRRYRYVPGGLGSLLVACSNRYGRRKRVANPLGGLARGGD